MVCLVVLITLLALLGAVENFRHQERLAAIPIRIHVNGTRGKSTTTRLIAAGLRQAGFRVIAKTTGSAARLIFEDGTEVPIRRGRRVSIREQLGIVAMAARRRADVLVVECMALIPENQWVCEHRIISSTIGVITNVREDHLDQMGPELIDIARALACTIPDEARLVTGEEQFFSLLQSIASERGTTVYKVGNDDLSNLACAVKVCELVGVTRDTALLGMSKVIPDPGAVKVLCLDADNRKVYFINGFAANDRTSTVMVWEQCCQRYGWQELPVFGVMNNRRDRPLRIRELAQVVQEIPFAQLFLVGELGPLAVREVTRAGLAKSQIIDLTKLSSSRVPSKIMASTPKSMVIFGFGNIKGPGWDLTEFFTDRGVECHDSPISGNRDCGEFFLH